MRIRRSDRLRLSTSEPTGVGITFDHHHPDGDGANTTDDGAPMTLIWASLNSCTVDGTVARQHNAPGVEFALSRAVGQQERATSLKWQS